MENRDRGTVRRTEMGAEQEGLEIRER